MIHSTQFKRQIGFNVLLAVFISLLTANHRASADDQVKEAPTKASEKASETADQKSAGQMTSNQSATAQKSETQDLDSTKPDRISSELSKGDRTEKSNFDFSWLDKSENIFVLQNRKYRKSGQLMLSLMGGPGSTTPYRSTWNIDPRLTYFFNETIGLEFFGITSFNIENNNFKALEYSSPNVLPVIREMNFQLGGAIHWNPWYAKINFFNSIVYFDWYLNLGGGLIIDSLDTRTNLSSTASYVSEKHPAIYIGTGHHYYLSDLVTLRLDVTGSFYPAKIYGTRGSTAWYNNTNFSLGFGIRL